MLLVQVGLNGPLIGAFYGLIGAGLSMVWGVSNVLNFSHGALIVLGAYLAFWAFTVFGIDPLLMVPLNMAIMGMVGWALYWAFIHWPRQRYRSGFMLLLLTFGVDLLIANGMLAAWSASFRSVATWYAGVGLALGPLRVPVVSLIAAVLALMLIGLLSLFLSRTRLGAAIEATGLDPEGAALVGINTSAINALVFGIGAALAGAAGCVLVLVTSISPFIGEGYMLRAALITVLGGLGSIPGLLVAGVLVGLAENYGSLVLSPAYGTTIGMFLLVMTLLFRPLGLLGRRYFSEG
jgi:branched-chain amino acid transport system permease protein